MSGIDEQKNVPGCSGCGGLHCWELRVINGNDNVELVGYINTETMLEEGSVVSIVELEEDWYRASFEEIQKPLYTIRCENCIEEATGLERKKVIRALEKHWDERKCI